MLTFMQSERWTDRVDALMLLQVDILSKAGVPMSMLHFAELPEAAGGSMWWRSL